MIKEEQLNAIAALKRLSPKNAEKEYFQEMILYTLASAAGKDLVFKGGTCLYKIYKINRFSEDLDFDAEKTDIEKIIKKALYGIKLLDINCSIKYIDKYENAINVGINFNGPLYDGSKDSLCFLLINFSLRQKAVLQPKLERIYTVYKEFPDFDVYAMDLKEILAEKVAAIHNRNKPRDVYDLWFLLTRLSVEFDRSLIKKKIKRQFGRTIFMKKILEKEGYWKGELGRLIIGHLPSFKEIKSAIESLVK